LFRVPFQSVNLCLTFRRTLFQSLVMIKVGAAHGTFIFLLPHGVEAQEEEKTK
jgi:hypothetical protein